MLNYSDLLCLHPYGTQVHDSHGRLIREVFACNPDTGEVICAQPLPHPRSRLRHLIPKLPPPLKTIAVHWFLRLRHGFWPAPLTLSPHPPNAKAELLKAISALND